MDTGGRYWQYYDRFYFGTLVHGLVKATVNYRAIKPSIWLALS